MHAWILANEMVSRPRVRCHLIVVGLVSHGMYHHLDRIPGKVLPKGLLCIAPDISVGWEAVFASARRDPFEPDRAILWCLDVSPRHWRRLLDNCVRIEEGAAGVVEVQLGLECKAMARDEVDMTLLGRVSSASVTEVMELTRGCATPWLGSFISDISDSCRGGRVFSVPLLDQFSAVCGTLSRVVSLAAFPRQEMDVAVSGNAETGAT